MKKIEEPGQVISTDVLVLGGGMAGLCAAIQAKEKPVDVLVVDKGGIGWAGQTPVGGGMIIHFNPEHADDWCRWLIPHGEYLHDQDWTYAVARDVHKTVMRLESLGLPFSKKGGEVAILPFEKMYDLTVFDAPKSLVKLKGAAKAKGVQFLDKIYVIDLLKHENRVAGALGFGLVDGKIYILQAKAVLIAVGSCRYMVENAFAVNSGEGPAMAYRAGAQLRNAEFANSYTFGARLVGRQFGGLTAFLHLENALGEKIMEKHYPEAVVGKKPGEERRDFRQIADAMIKEAEAGRGPIYLDLRKLTPDEMDRLMAKNIPVLQQLAEESFTLLKEKAGLDPMKGKIEMHPQFIGGQGPVRIDLDCRTTVEGLWAAGDAPSLGSGWTGARSSGGSYRGFGLCFAPISGFRAGQTISEYAASTKRFDIDAGEVNRVKERVFAPLGRKGNLNSEVVIYEVHKAMVPVKNTFLREAGRLKNALKIIEGAKQNLPKVSAADFHELMRYHQAESMALAAEFTTKAALMREESRGQHYREDFPNRDDKNWLKWIVLQEKDGVPRLSTEPVPIEKYKVKPN